MAAYFIEMISQGNADGNNEVSLKDLKATAVKANKIEKMKRTFKTHRCAFDFDNGFVKIKVTREEEDEDEDKDEEKDKKNEVKKEMKEVKNEEQENKSTNTTEVYESATI